ncbi:hypothetical protein EVAR_95546_1 [Eumeta japonica]|uniref:Uncharacterized protein n=1 Tax=Eumeta variegata TaxID=151549 RepID=A0A4C1UK74_EUMVA|nr:hypothetical protein EVAR_95546_1 [Eumeta japonica]
MGDTCRPGARKTRVFRRLSSLCAHAEVGYESVEELDSQSLDYLTIFEPQIYIDGNRIEGKDGLVNISTSFLEILTGPKAYHPLAQLGITSLISLRKARLCAYSGLERMTELRETIVQTSSSGRTPSPRRRQRTTIDFRCRMQRRTREETRIETEKVTKIETKSDIRKEIESQVGIRKERGLTTAPEEDPRSKLEAEYN